MGARRYLCCNGDWPCSGRCGEQRCPEFCLCLVRARSAAPSALVAPPAGLPRERTAPPAPARICPRPIGGPAPTPPGALPAGGQPVLSPVGGVHALDDPGAGAAGSGVRVRALAAPPPPIATCAVQDEGRLSNTACDNAIIFVTVAAQYLSCLCWVRSCRGSRALPRPSLGTAAFLVQNAFSGRMLVSCMSSQLICAAAPHSVSPPPPLWGSPAHPHAVRGVHRRQRRAQRGSALDRLDRGLYVVQASLPTMIPSCAAVRGAHLKKPPPAAPPFPCPAACAPA